MQEDDERDRVPDRGGDQPNTRKRKLANLWELDHVETMRQKRNGGGKPPREYSFLKCKWGCDVLIEVPSDRLRELHYNATSEHTAKCAAYAALVLEGVCPPVLCKAERQAASKAVVHEAETAGPRTRGECGQTRIRSKYVIGRVEAGSAAARSSAISPPMSVANAGGRFVFLPSGLLGRLDGGGWVGKITRVIDGPDSSGHFVKVKLGSAKGERFADCPYPVDATFDIKYAKRNFVTLT